MTLRNRKAVKAIAVLLVFSIAQIYVQANFAVTNLARKASAFPATQAITARITTRGNQAILVNGNNVSSGGTLLTGATIETPDAVGATIDLGPLGTVDLAPNTKVELQFEDGKIRVKVIQGCVIVKPKKGTAATVDTDQGTAASMSADGTMTGGDPNNNNKKGGALDVCLPPGSTTPISGAGAAANAGAGAGAGSSGAAAASGAAASEGGGLGGAALGGIIGGAIATVVVVAIVVNRDDERNNPSPARP